MYRIKHIIVQWINLFQALTSGQSSSSLLQRVLRRLPLQTDVQIPAACPSRYKGVYTPKIATHSTSKGHFSYRYHRLWQAKIIPQNLYPHNELAYLLRSINIFIFVGKFNCCNDTQHFFQGLLTITITPHHSRFTALFPGPPGSAGARRELLDFTVQGKINRGRHTDHPAGRHSIRTNQCPPPPSPIFFTGRMPFLPPNQQCQNIKALIINLHVCSDGKNFGHFPSYVNWKSAFRFSEKLCEENDERWTHVVWVRWRWMRSERRRW